MIEIQTQKGLPIDFHLAVLEETAKQTLALTNTPEESVLSVYLTTDAELQQLNREHLGIDAPTDVLSFPIPFDDPESGQAYLGDILISVPTAARQAEAGGHPLEDEIQLLLVHGILHLLGHDHTTSAEKSAMWQIQESILTSLEIKARPTES
jgi:probable rRNA maturation factor